MQARQTEAGAVRTRGTGGRCLLTTRRRGATQKHSEQATKQGREAADSSTIGKGTGSREQEHGDDTDIMLAGKHGGRREEERQRQGLLTKEKAHRGSGAAGLVVRKNPIR